jgi:hypothetical protein
LPIGSNIGAARGAVLTLMLKLVLSEPTEFVARTVTPRPPTCSTVAVYVIRPVTLLMLIPAGALPSE